MKKILLILMALMLWICPVWADEIDEALPENTRLQIRSNTRLMVDAGISKDDATKLTRSMLQHRFTEGHIIEVQNMLMETIQADLPVGPVMNKAFEGMAKNIPEETIVQAMKTMQLRHAHAKRIAQKLTTDEETQDRIRMSIAQGMGAGLQNENIDLIMEQLLTRTRQMSQNKADELCLQTFLTTRLMARLGVEPNNVSDVVSQALQNRFTAREMQQLRSNFNSRSHEMSPNQLANQFSQKLGQGEKAGDSGSSNENNAGQSGSNQGSGSEPGNTSEDTGGSKSGSDTGGSGGSGGSGGTGGGNGKQ
jgi:hypothetical protein